MAENPRIEELRRRVQRDPASIAFAQLAEEHRRAGNYEEAVEVARAGLQQHSAYLSARVTLGRALLELGRLDEAAEEFEYVVQAAPDNLTAVRQLADIHQRRHQSSNDTRRVEKPIETSTPSDGLKPIEPARIVEPATAVAPPGPAEPVNVVSPPPPAPEPPRVSVGPAITAEPQLQEEPIIAELEAWLSVLATERDAREGASGFRVR